MWCSLFYAINLVKLSNTETNKVRSIRGVDNFFELGGGGLGLLNNVGSTLYLPGKF